MQTSIAEQRALSASTAHTASPVRVPPAIQPFHLPKLNVNVPRRGTLCLYEHSHRELAQQLVQARVIAIRSLPDSVETAGQMVQVGLKNWFRKHLGELEAIKIKAQILDREALDDMRNLYEGDKEFGNHYALALVCDDFRFRTMEKQIAEVERHAPELARTALEAIYRASYRTVDIFTPLEIFNEFGLWNWEADWSEVPTDDEARECLADRFGEEEIPESYLPSQAVPAFGGDICLHIDKEKKFLSRASLAAIAKTTGNGYVAEIASVTLKLKRALAKAERVDARFPDLCGMHAMCTERMVLAYRDNDYVTETHDMLVESAWSAGENTDLLGIESLPTSVEELKTYFKNMRVACTVLRLMDRLIALISEQAN